MTLVFECFVVAAGRDPFPLAPSRQRREAFCSETRQEFRWFMQCSRKS